MELNNKYIKTKRIIGNLDRAPIDLIITYGGFNILFVNKKDKSEIIGAGPHLAVAKNIAEKKYKNIKWNL